MGLSPFGVAIGLSYTIEQCRKIALFCNTRNSQFKSANTDAHGIKLHHCTHKTERGWWLLSDLMVLAGTEKRSPGLKKF